MTSLQLNLKDPLLKLETKLENSIQRAQELFLKHQFHEGYWWYTLEANESISAEYIFLCEFTHSTHPQLNAGLCRRIIQKQQDDGSWSLYFEGPGDLGATIECYWALKLCGYSVDHPAMVKARTFILAAGGPTQARVFSKIHMALFGLAPWEAVPAMPIEFILAPKWSPINIYEFSSWARACIVPLLVILDKKPVLKSRVTLDELYPHPTQAIDWKFTSNGKLNGNKYTLENFFLFTDGLLKKLGKIKKPKPLTQPIKKRAIKECEKYIREHVEKTEDIFPALAYSIMALSILGYDLKDPIIAKAFRALQGFQQSSEASYLPPIPQKIHEQEIPEIIHQQCCVSPVWDTPWMALSLLESGIPVDHPAIKKSADWLLEKQVVEIHGDWAVKNKKALPGGWAFEFENHYFPDVDDTIEVLTLLHKVGLNNERLKNSFDRGFQWLMSMQSKNGGWAAFDIDQTLELVNRIPFSDHGACLDPPTADITGRVLEFLALVNYDRQSSIVQEALRFIYQEQLECGAWEGRWGVNYLYGTWCALQGLIAIGEDPKNPAIIKAIEWLLAQQNPDGGWGESCLGYAQKDYVPLSYSVPSQSAWALMALIDVGMADSVPVKRGIDYLISQQNEHGCWDEEAYTGTGFPGHFYIRYHGYRHYFPLFALGKYKNALRS